MLLSRAVLALALVSSTVLAAPPAARVEPVTDDYYGTKVTDPYRWMESGKDPAWTPWLRAQADYTRSVLDKIPGRAALLADVQARSGGLAAVGRAQQAGDWFFYHERPAGAEDFQLVVRDKAGKSRVLYAPKAGPGALVIDDWVPSPDGKQVALSLSQRGTERSVLHILDTATGKLGTDKISDVGGAAWLADGRVAYLQFVGEHGTPSYYVKNRMRVHRPGDTAEDQLIPTRGLAGVPVKNEQFVYAAFTPGSDTALLIQRDGRSEFAIYRAPAGAAAAGTAIWTRVADFSDTIVDADVAGDDLYLTSRKSNSNGQVLRLAAATAKLDTAQPITIPGNPVIESVVAMRSGVLVRTLEGGLSGLWFAPKAGAPRKLALPIEGTVSWVENDPRTDEALFGMTSWFTPSQVYHLAENGAVHDLKLVAPPPFDTSGYEAKRLTATAKDGTKIPYTILTRKGAAPSPSTPLLLEAYGSYGAAMSPRFRSSLLPFLDRGGAYVMANVRGGGEFGRSWHYAGKAETKATTWRDAIAVAEKLVADGSTSPASMSIIGTSAGGVMVGGAVNERPDLFSGAIANVGFMNPLRYVSEQNYADIEEWGGPITDAKTFKTMYDMDPYVHIRDGVKYPATLVVSGINDPRAATFHSAKYAARLAKASASGEPVLLRLDFDAGHGMGSSRSQADAMWTDIYSFVLWQGGAKDFQPTP